MSDYADTPAVAAGATDIFVVGTGIESVRHLTLEAVECLRSCTTVFTVDHGFGSIDFIAGLGPDVVDLIPEYKEGLHRLVTYQRMAARVVEKALANPPVALAVYGHPSWLVFPAELVRDAAQALGLNVQVIAGISSLDTMVIELGIDPAARGLQIHESTGLVLYQHRIEPRMPCLLLQVDAFRLETFSRHRGESGRLQDLVDYLGRYYPLSHMIESIYSRTHPLMRPIRMSFPLSELTSAYHRPGFSGSIYLPALPQNGGSEPVS